MLLQIGTDGSLVCFSRQGKPYLTVAHQAFNGRPALLISVCTFGMHSQIEHSWPRVNIVLSAKGDDWSFGFPPAFDASGSHQPGGVTQATLRLLAPSELQGTELQVLSEEHAVKLYLFANASGQAVNARLPAHPQASPRPAMNISYQMSSGD